MPRWFIEMPSDTDTVVNSNGVPPAIATPILAASACGRSDSEHGVFSPCVLITPTKGLPIASSSRPIARRKVRCGARSAPSTVMRERSGSRARPARPAESAELFNAPFGPIRCAAGGAGFLACHLRPPVTPAHRRKPLIGRLRRIR